MTNEILAPKQICFVISDVKPGTERLPEVSLRVLLERTVKSPALACPKADQQMVAGGDFHPLIAAAAIAYQQHFPLVLSPDMIWLTILQGVAQHIANHAESLRSRLVPHQTKMELVVATDLNSLPNTDADMLAATLPFVELLNKHVQPDKHFLLKTKFSTTTDIERIAGYIVLMDAFQPYFDYVFKSICGIPSVTLEGIPDDWDLLATKVKLLHDSDLDLSWWTRQLLPLCDQFKRASRGDVDQNHWQNLCKLVERYGEDDLNGWLLKFIPYVRKNQNELPVYRNPVLEFTNYDGPTDKNAGSRFAITGCTSNMLPTGISRVPVTCQIRSSGKSLNLQFLAGLVGVGQSPEDLSLRPVIGWAIAEGSRIDRLIAQLRVQHEVSPPEAMETKALIQIFDGNLPADLWRFYTETGGARLEFKRSDHKNSCIIKPATEVKHVIEFGRELAFLSKQGVLTPNELHEWQQFARRYCHLREFAEAYDGQKHYVYVFGSDPESSTGDTVNESRGEIFRWTKEATPESFEPVAHTFSDWLEAILQDADK